MVNFAHPPLSRDPLVLFPEKLDRAIPERHIGQPPIHPRVIASIVLCRFLCRICTSRTLEESLTDRNNFRWLLEGRTIDHTTICKFRQKNSEALKELFVQIVLVARDLGHVPLETLGFNGTRMRADNRTLMAEERTLSRTTVFRWRRLCDSGATPISVILELISVPQKRGCAEH